MLKQQLPSCALRSARCLTFAALAAAQASCAMPAGIAAPAADAQVDGSAVPIAHLATQMWTWVPVDGAICRDGSPTGIGVRWQPGARGLVVLLLGGGVCIDAATCASNPSAFGAEDFSALVAIEGTVGILDSSDPANPLRDFSFAVVPYCTGDVHAGNNDAALPQGLASAQHAVGYRNMGLYLKRLVPTFAGTELVVLAGVSAGGVGAALNYMQVARAFGNTPVHLLDDSGPGAFLSAPALATCLQEEFEALWRLDDTVFADCGAACSGGSDRLAAYGRSVVSSFPRRSFGLVESTDDATVTQFLGKGADGCTGITPMPADAFVAGLLEVRSSFGDNPNFGSYYFDGSDHTSLVASSFDTRQVGGTLLTGWIAGQLAGHVTNVGP
jgi:hypothetical protein